MAESRRGVGDADIFADWNTFARQQGLDTVTDVDSLLHSRPRPKRRVVDEQEEFRVEPFRQDGLFYPGPPRSLSRPRAPHDGFGLSSPLPIFAGILVALLIGLALYLGLSPTRRRRALQEQLLRERRAVGQPSLAQQQQQQQQTTTVRTATDPPAVFLTKGASVPSPLATEAEDDVSEEEQTWPSSTPPPTTRDRRATPPLAEADDSEAAPRDNVDVGPAGNEDVQTATATSGDMEEYLKLYRDAAT